MVRRRSSFALILVFAPGAAFAAFQGYVERPWTPTPCLQGSHFLTDPCTGAFTGGLMLLNESQAMDLDPFVCTHVTVDGSDIGISASSAR